MDTWHHISRLEFDETTGEPNPVEVLRVGAFDYWGDMDLVISREMLAEIKQNFDDNVLGRDVAFDVSHDPSAGAVGWIKELRLNEPGTRLSAVPSWTPEGETLIREGKFRYASSEIQETRRDQETGTVHRNVLAGVGLTNRPHISGLRPISLSEDCSALRWSYLTHDPDGDESPVLEEGPATLGEREEAKAAQKARSSRYGIGIKKGTNTTKPSQYASIDDEDFADPVNYAYPVTPQYVMAAYRYFAKARNQAKYTPAEQKIIWRRIIPHLPEENREEARKVAGLSERGIFGESVEALSELFAHPNTGAEGSKSKMGEDKETPDAVKLDATALLAKLDETHRLLAEANTKLDAATTRASKAEASAKVAKALTERKILKDQVEEAMKFAESDPTGFDCAMALAASHPAPKTGETGTGSDNAGDKITAATKVTPDLKLTEEQVGDAVEAILTATGVKTGGKA
jgi:hypothetical protein